MYGRCIDGFEFDTGGGRFAKDSAPLMLIYLVVLIVLLAAVAALTVAEWRRAPGGSGTPRGHLLVIVLVVPALFVWAVADSLFGPLYSPRIIDHATYDPRLVVTGS
jgi:hypothetical protein